MKRRAESYGSLGRVEGSRRASCEYVGRRVKLTNDQERIVRSLTHTLRGTLLAFDGKLAKATHRAL
jgi:hypothetical protein